MGGMTVHHFDAAAIDPTPWKNGGGDTREVLCWPPGAGFDTFDWRVSLATIASSGPFSSFPGIDRTIMLLEGKGVRLRSKEDGIDHRLDTLWEPFAFPGEAGVFGKLADGTTTDFNLMVRRGRLTSSLSIHRGAFKTETTPHGFLMSLSGTWRLAVGSGDLLCPPQQGVWWAGTSHHVKAAPGSNDGEAAMLAIRLTPPD